MRLAGLTRDVRYALRALWKNPSFAAIAMLSLALGIGANTAIFTFVNAALLKPLPYPQADRIVALQQRFLSGAGTTAVHPRSFLPWRDRAQSFEAMAIAQAVPANTQGPEGAEQVPGLWMTADLFRVFGVRPMLGRDFAPTEGASRTSIRGETAEPSEVVILSHGYWQRRFGGDRGIIGRSIPMGRRSATVIGVMPAGFRVGTLSIDIYRAIPIDRARPESIGSRSFLCFARLRPGATVESARAEMTVIANQVSAEEPTEKEFGVVVLSLRDYLVRDSRLVLLILAGVVAFVLLVACANLAGLLLTRALGRQGEFALRTALGASRWRIVRQLIAESTMIAVLGGGLGVFLGWAGSKALVLIAQDAVSFGQMSDVRLDARVLAFSVALSLLTALIFGLAPAWQASRIDLQSAVKTQGRATSRGQNRARAVLVVGQVALAVVLLVGAGLLLRTLNQLMDVKVGFATEHVLTMRTLVFGTTAFRSGLVESILDRVETLPGVQAAGTIQFLPLSGHTNNGPFHFVGRPLPADPNSMQSDVSTVSRGYFSAMGIELVRGRAFDRTDRLDSPRVALVNQSFVKKFSPDEDPIGRVILGDWANPKPTQIVGVVGDVRHNGLDAQPRPTVFLAQAQVPGYITYLIMRTQAEPAALAAAVRREVRRIDPHQPFTDVLPLDHYVSTALARPKLYASLIGAFASLALLLASIGLYGLMAYAVTRRTHEIGVRMALGAQPGDVLRSTLGEGTRLVLIGLALGSAAAVAMSRIVAGFLYGVTAHDPFTYAAVATLLVCIALLAVFVPARRASRVDPMVALRYE